ncbi:MAG TPA: zf-HC2 domain-containing protein [Streptosporangiaceae bacterium]|nr:zf-HC2 domain-containing protein [Streptosporangiaceae bacterium]
MLSDRDIELAHPEAFDYVFGNLPTARRADFDRHLAGCRYCQSVITEYGEIGGIIKLLPPHVEPPADLEDRTVAAMLAAVGEQAAEPETLIKPRSQPGPAAAAAAATQPRPVLVNQPGPAETADPPAVPNPPAVTRLPVWRRYPGRLAAAVAIAAAIIAAAVVVPLRGSPAQATVVIALRVTSAGQAQGFGAATGQAVARQDASGSWDITLTVQHLKHFDPKPWYECWYVSQHGRLAASAGTFLVPVSGSRTFTMTSAADPRDFRTMEITLQSPSNDGALGGVIILQGQSPVGA